MRAPRHLSFPWGFLLALVLVAALAVLHAAGLRDWVSVLSGTPVADVPWALSALGGASYALAWFGAVLLAPILALTSALRALSDARAV